jgi:hypothetical protein
MASWQILIYINKILKAFYGCQWILLWKERKYKDILEIHVLLVDLNYQFEMSDGGF